MTAPADMVRARRLGYRASLDGLRGIAVLLVLVYHLPHGVPNAAGQVGVVIFFALSGFLITTLLIEEHATRGAIDLPHFYKRRALRLLPLMCTVMALLIVLDVLLGSQAHYRKTALLALFYASNWAIISGLDFGPIEHTWTLAIEEHFYLLWPLTMVLVLRRWSRSALLRIAVAAALCSWTGRVVLWASGASLERVTYGTDTRLDGLLIGCILGLTAWERIRRVPLGATVAALAVLVTAVTVPTTGFHVVAGYTAVSVATLVIIAGCLTSERVAGVLDRRPLVPIGRISYGLYLWHLPIYGTVFLYGGGLLSKPVQMVTAVVMSFIVAACSYASIERPFLRLKRRGRQRGVGATPGCVGAAVLAPPVDSGAAEPGGQPAGPLLPAQRGPS